MDRLLQNRMPRKLRVPDGSLGLSLFISLCFWASGGLNGQPNLVSNGSFESSTWCPSSYNNSTLRTAVGWSQPTQGTPDHFKSCSSDAGVPRNAFGEQAAVDGEAYAGLVTYSASKPTYREYIQTELTRTLIRGEWVCVSWWVCSADAARLVADGMGAHLGAQAPKAQGEGVLNVQPQVDNPRFHLASDRHSWMMLSDVVQAEGGERFLTIGNFRPPRENRVLERRDAAKDSSPWAYVYIDDVQVGPVADPAECSCLNRTYAEEATDPPWEVYLKDRVALSSVLFGFDESTLDEEAVRQLDEVASTMRKNRYLVMEVNGHTDVIGPDGYNLALSESRAQAVLAYLVAHGVDPNRMKLAYHGSRLPVADNDSQEGRKQNRRVEFELLEHAFLPLQ
jgi:OOP family OmpA-OmpF porin